MHDCCTGNKYWAVATRGKLGRYDLCTSKNKQRKKQVKRILMLMLPSRDFKTIKSQNNYCSIGARSILTISHYHWVFFSQTVYWRHRHLEILDVFFKPNGRTCTHWWIKWGGGGFRVAISFRFSCDDSQFLYAVSSLCYNVWLMVHE